MDIYLIVRKSKRRTQNLLKSLKKPIFEVKGRQYTTGKVIQSLFNVDLQGVPKVRSSNFMRYNFWSKLYFCMQFLEGVYFCIKYMYSEFQ